MHQVQYPRAFSALAVALCLAGAAHAGVIRNLATPGIEYTSIQAAVDAAAEGDVLLLSSGAYMPFTIDGKSLTLTALPGSTVSVQGTVIVRNLPADREVDLIGLSTFTPWISATTGPPGLLLHTNAGHVRIADCNFVGASATGGSPSGTRGGSGIEIIQCAQVVLIDCTAQGGAGNREFCPYPPWTFTYAGDGGDGILSVDSLLSIHGGDFRGGLGGDGEMFAGNGGSGYHCSSAYFLAAGASFLGAAGGKCTGYDECLWRSGDGGHGIYLGVGPAKLLDVASLGGPSGYFWPPARPGVPGVAYAGPGIYTGLPGIARTLSTPRIAGDGLPVSVGVSGVPGEQVLCAASAISLFTFVPPFSGTWLIDGTDYGRRANFLGTISGSGSSNFSFTTAALLWPEVARRTTMQCQLLASGQKTLSDPALQVLIDRASAPDCNGNGVNDFVDLVQGTSLDLNANLIPDECDSSFGHLYVDASAPPGGNGSPALPFQSLGPAFQFAFDGDTIHVANGTYDGASNRNLDFAGRDLAVRSNNGPASCVIDLQAAGRAFSLAHSESATARIEGFTIQNGAELNGAAIELVGSSPTIENCVFIACSAQERGGAIRGTNSSARISDCTFIDNHAGPALGYDLGGGAIALQGGIPSIGTCSFRDNASDGIGGAILVQPGPTGLTLISHCEFRTNSAASGGAIGAPGLGWGTLHVVNSLLAGNTANSGGALACERTAGMIINCTFSSNLASDAGVLSVRNSSTPGWTFANSILWGNGATQVYMQETAAALTFVYNDVKGGPGTIVSTGGNLVWTLTNIDANPLFIDSSFNLGSSSPCLDSADNNRVPADSLDLDGDGNTTERIPVDLNFLPRFVDIPGAPNTGNGQSPLVDRGCQERQAP